MIFFFSWTQLLIFLVVRTAVRHWRLVLLGFGVLFAWHMMQQGVGVVAGLLAFLAMVGLLLFGARRAADRIEESVARAMARRRGDVVEGGADGRG